MRKDETLSRVQALHGARGSSALGTAQRHPGTTGRASQAGSEQPKQARPEAETKGYQAFRFGPRRKRPLVDRLFFFHLAGDFGPGQTLSENPPYSKIKAVTVVRVPPIVVAERPFVDVAEQVKWLHADIGPMQPA